MVTPTALNLWPHLKQYLPQEVYIDTSDVYEKQGRFSVNQQLNRSVLERDDTDEMIQHLWNRMYQKMLYKMAGLMMGKDCHYVVRWEPYVMEGHDPVYGGITLLLEMSVFIANTHDVVIPNLVYTDYDSFGHREIVEWRCGSCGNPNPIESRHCSPGCGAQRALLLHEMT